MLGAAKKGEWARCNFDPPVASAAEITDFAVYMQRRMADKHMDAPPTACVTIQRWFYDFRVETQRRSRSDGYVPVSQRRSALDFVQVVTP